MKVLSTLRFSAVMGRSLGTRFDAPAIAANVGSQSTAASISFVTTPAGTVPFDLGVDERITVNIARRAKDTVVAALTLDTIAVKTTGNVPDVSSLIGAKFVALVSPTGSFYSVRNPEGLDPQLAQLVEGVPRILPSFRSNLATGRSWSDTLAGKVSQSGMVVDRTIVSTYHVEADTTIGGERAFRIGRTSLTKGAGTGSLQGAPIRIEMAGTSAGELYITPKGAYLGGTVKDELLIRITVVQQNLEVVIRQSTTTLTQPVN